MDDTTTPIQKALWCDSDIGHLKDVGKGEGNLTELELKTILRRYNLRDGLVIIGRMSSAAFNDNSEHRIGKAAVREPKTGVFITQFALAYLANALITSGGNDYRSKQIGDKQNLLTLLNVYSNDLIAPELKRDKTVPFTRKDLVSSLVRMHAEQFEYQFDYRNLIARTIVIFTDIANSITPEKFEPLNTIFEREVELSFQDYLTLVMAVWSSTQELATFRKEVLTTANIPSMQSAFTEEKIENFLKMLSTDYETFRRIDTEANTNLDPVFTKYRFNPLLIYPIIKTDKNMTDPYVVPNTLCLFKKGFGGLYWWFHRYFEISGNQLAFRTYYGKLFEQYAGIVLKHMYGDSNVHPEVLYPKGKFFDWWVQKDSKIYLFEIKAYQFALPTKQTGDPQAIVKEVKSKIVETVVQVYKRISEIEKYKELAVFKDKEIIPVVVFMEIPLVSGHLYKEMVQDELELLEKDFTGIKDLKIHLLNIEELELYQSVVDKVSLEEVFNRYEKDLSQGFISTIHTELGGTPRNDYLDKVCMDFLNRMTGDVVPGKGV